MEIKIGHAGDADDAFMYFGLASGKTDTGDFRIVLDTQDIRTLNDRASRGQYELTAISTHAYAYVRDRYVVARCGGTFGDGFGPVVISREPIAPEDIRNHTVAVPGATTSAYLALQLHSPGQRTMVLPSDKIIPAVQTGVVDCGLTIQESQISYAQAGLCSVLDLGTWWAGKTDGLPLPLSVNVIRRNLSPDVQARLADILSQSIRYGVDHRDEAIAHAMASSGHSDGELVGEFVGKYVTDLACDMGDRGRRAIEEFLSQAHQAGIIPDVLPIELV